MHPNFAIIVPSRRFDGTNALARMPIDLIETHYDEDNMNTPEYGNAIMDKNGLIYGNYGYNYHLFKTGKNGYDIIKMVHPLYFYYYGYYGDFDELEMGSWRTELLEEDIYIYTYNGYLRSGEYLYRDTTIITDVADYYVEYLYEVSSESTVVPFKKVRYEVLKYN